MKFEITEEQIKELSERFGSDNQTKLRSELTNQLKQWFPEVFEPKTGWFKTKTEGNESYLMYFENGLSKYGFNGIGRFIDNACSRICNDEYPATDEEVLKALTNEAIKRGFLKGVYVKPLWGRLNYWELDTNRFVFNSETNNLHLGLCVFNNGKWAEIIKTYTKEQAEKMLNAKIID